MIESFKAEVKFTFQVFFRFLRFICKKIKLSLTFEMKHLATNITYHAVNLSSLSTNVISNQARYDKCMTFQRLPRLDLIKTYQK